jgi:cyclopropane fatty-acyl-phospholipid synthase-like methyltransferase
VRIVDIFDNANIYKLFQFAITSSNTSRVIRDEVLKPDHINDVLDFGCGVGYHSLEFKDANYLGIEPLTSCVQKAHKMYSSANSRFILGDHRSLQEIPDSSFDLVIAIGVLHHVNDSIATAFIKESRRILRSGGRLATFDPVIHKNQSLTSKFIVKRDRGQWVRQDSAYLSLVEESFNGKITSKIYKRLLRIPYDHILIEIYK